MDAAPSANPHFPDILAPLRKPSPHLALFHEIARALTSRLEEKQVLEVIMSQLDSLIHPQEWTVLSGAEGDTALEVELAVGSAGEALVGRRFECGARPLAPAVQAFLRGQPVRAEVYASEVISLGAPGFYAPRRVLALPLIAQGRTLGVIELVDASEETLDPMVLEALGTVAAFAAIGMQNARQVRQLRELSVIDEHTGLWNARRLRERLQAELERARRYAQPLSLLFLDLDRLERINQTHGHLAGTALLRAVGERLSTNIRKVDAAFRYGGDELVVMLPETPREGAGLVQARLLSALEETPYALDEERSVSLSFGVGLASSPHDGDSVDVLLAAASLAMYADKARRRVG